MSADALEPQPTLAELMIQDARDRYVADRCTVEEYEAEVERALTHPRGHLTLEQTKWLASRPWCEP